MICPKKQRPAAGEAAGGGKNLRACDSCVCRRARWYCAADDAFLCQNCDSSVHSANPLARRHHRVGLQVSPPSESDTSAPAWHHGFKRKARTPRPSKGKIGGVLPLAPAPLVPEMETSGEDGSNNEEEQLLYRVPIFDPVLAEFCSPAPLVDETKSEAKLSFVQLPAANAKFENSETNSNNNEFFAGFLQSDAELAEFAADMESLLGRGLENGSFSMEELGLVDMNYSPEECERVKEEMDNDLGVIDDGCGDVKLYEEIDLSRETLEINFDCRSGDKGQEDVPTVAAEAATSAEGRQEGKKIGLRLDYEAIAEEWSANGTPSPWMNGQRPQFGPDDCWLDCMGMWGGKEMQGRLPGSQFDEGREARVSRYREKRRTRLFAKKIRYEVRKLNAEKRPRMKGRFVKRASFTAAAGPSPAAFKY